jgi:putative hydrolase of the HAD superfamily
VWRATLAAFGIHDESVIDDACRVHLAAEERGFVLYDDVLHTLAALGDAGVPLGIITNGDPELQQRKIRAAGLGALIASVTVSGQRGAPKPDRRIFDAALDSLALAGEARLNAVHVGDSLAADVRGARGAGMGAIWLDRDGIRDGDDEPDATIRSLRELPELLGLSAGSVAGGRP